jgi:hypothetical protein
VKKLISIGVALALLTLAVLPGAAAAYTEPTTFSKVPFAILQSGIELLGGILDSLGTTLGLPTWLNSALLNPIGAWTGGPLSWTVDMLGWFFHLIGSILTALPTSLGVPSWATDIVNTIACGIFTPFGNVTGPAFVCP